MAFDRHGSHLQRLIYMCVCVCVWFIMQHVCCFLAAVSVIAWLSTFGLHGRMLEFLDAAPFFIDQPFARFQLAAWRHALLADRLAPRLSGLLAGWQAGWRAAGWQGLRIR